MLHFWDKVTYLNQGRLHWRGIGGSPVHRDLARDVPQDALSEDVHDLSSTRRKLLSLMVKLGRQLIC